MGQTSAQEGAVEKAEQKDAAQPKKTITLSTTGETIEVTQATVPTGIFPLPRFLRHWAGLS